MTVRMAVKLAVDWLSALTLTLPRPVHKIGQLRRFY